MKPHDQSCRKKLIWIPFDMLLQTGLFFCFSFYYYLSSTKHSEQNVFCSQMQYKWRDEYIQVFPVKSQSTVSPWRVTYTSNPKGCLRIWRDKLLVLRTELQSGWEQDLHDTHCLTGPHQSVSPCRFSHQYQTDQGAAQHPEQNLSVSACSCSFRDALLGCMT